ncbi:DUF5052 family protein [Bifidobacterium sp. SO1]|uniref:DUF5052 family protein n=1 Tax=Bifidobacterium sp. SO1 TaxID=2809029 RepID=UPI001BDC8F00|nr:DUF5052 family protein [Bifidobacterium sp. SO1]MBT1162944.1 DUF5052 family protein [Bifidobacterium sp. SO1]
MRKTIGRITGILLTMAMIVPLASCAAFSSIWGDVKGQLVGQAFTMTAFDNSGNETLTAHGTKVGMSGNKVKDSASSDGSTSTSLSAVVTITMDGKEIESAGDTLIFNEDGLQPVKDYAKEKTEIASRSKDWTDNTLVAKPLNRFRNLFGKKRIVLIKSQLGDPIEAYQGDEVYWEVRDDLPKTTKIQIDGKALYVHRANFQIIDASLLN